MENRMWAIERHQ